MKKFVSVLLLALVLPACGKNKKNEATSEAASFTTVHQSDADARSQGAATDSDCSSCEEAWDRGMALHHPAYEEAGAPQGTDALAQELRGRHAATVPRGEELAERELAAEQLRFLAEHGALLVERQRALSLLRHFASSVTRALLMGIARDEEALVPLRAAALRGLKATADPTDAEVKSILLDALRSPDRGSARVSGTLKPKKAIPNPINEPPMLGV